MKGCFFFAVVAKVTSRDLKMATRYFSSLTIVVVTLSGGVVWADGLSYNGVTGTLTLPNAYTAEQGVVTYQYNNYGENFYKNQYSDTFNHVITIGVTPNLEVGGRLTNYNDGGGLGKRDLSGNIKFRLPELGYGLPDFALGANDVAGEAVNFRSQYLVASKKLGKGIYSLGYAVGDEPALDGVFGSAQYDFTSDLSLMAEYASSEYNLGARYDFSRLTKLPVSLTASVPFNTDNDDVVLGVSISKPLTSDARNNLVAKNTQLAFESGKEDLNTLAQTLAAYGFESISIGHTKSNEVIIAYENKVYNHSYLDGLALVSGAALRHVDHSKVVNLVILENKIPKLAVRFPLASLRDYFTKNDSLSKSHFLSGLRAWYPTSGFLSPKNVTWMQGVARGSKTWFDVTLQPKLRTAIGTEWSEADYSLALGADLDVSLWKGGSAHLSAVAPVSNSEYFDDGEVFSNNRYRSGVQEALIQQTVKPSRKTVVTGSAGLMEVQDDMYYTVQSEAGWVSDSGRSGIYAKAATFEPKDDEQGQESANLALASLKHSLPHYGVSAELEYGRYFEGDNGLKLNLARQIGSAEVLAYVKYVDKDDIEGGLTLAFPLTPRKDFKRGPLVVRGSERWSYSQGTTIKDPVVAGANSVRFNNLYNPSPSKTVKDGYFEAGLLSPAYLKANAHRLREAYVNLRN